MIGAVPSDHAQVPPNQNYFYDEIDTIAAETSS
jgi:hypothetical protein